MNCLDEPEDALAGFEGWYLASFTVLQAKAAGLSVVRTPEHGIGHCDVIGKKTRSIQAALAKASAWVIGPPVASAD